MTNVRVLVIDDHVLFAEAIRLALEADHMEVVGIAGTADEALEAVRRWRPDVAFVDIGLPDQDGLTLGKAILQEYPETKLVALSALDDPRTVREAIRAGFAGYVVKDTPLLRLRQAVGSVLSGQVVMPRPVAPRVAGALSAEEEAVALLTKQLTPREREVLELLVEGASGQDIARSLGISPNTVRTHVQSVLTKLQVRSRLEAATFAVRHRRVLGPSRRLAWIP